MQAASDDEPPSKVGKGKSISTARDRKGGKRAAHVNTPEKKKKTKKTKQFKSQKYIEMVEKGDIEMGDVNHKGKAPQMEVLEEPEEPEEQSASVSEPQ